jgi:hypothetical protein
MEWEALLRAVEGTLLPESAEAVEEILNQDEAYRQQTRREEPGGEVDYKTHGFIQWLCALQDGWAALPEKIPHAVILAWRNGHANHPAGATPVPVCRCEDCRMVLPNCTVHGFGDYLTPCPVCGSERIAWADLSKPWGTFLPWKKQGQTRR